MNSEIGKVINEITSRLVDEFNPEKIFLFGSYAWGKPDENSDLDMMIIARESKLKPPQRAAVAYQCARGISLPFDFIVKTAEEFDEYASVPASLEKQVLKNGRILYERS